MNEVAIGAKPLKRRQFKAGKFVMHKTTQRASSVLRSGCDAPEIDKSIIETSRREGLSLNKATLRLREGSVHKPSTNTDFEEFSGAWSRTQADEFDTALAAMRRVDPADCQPAE